MYVPMYQLYSFPSSTRKPCSMLCITTAGPPAYHSMAINTPFRHKKDLSLAVSSSRCGLRARADTHGQHRLVHDSTFAFALLGMPGETFPQRGLGEQLVDDLPRLEPLGRQAVVLNNAPVRRQFLHWPTSPDLASTHVGRQFFAL